MHLAIRADGGPKLGYGHLVRSNALAEEFRSRDNKVTVSTTTPQSARSVFPGTAEIIELPSRGDPEPFLNWLDANQPDAVFTDSYPVDTEYQRAVRDRVPLAVLQDDDRHAVCADLFINGNLYAPDLDYEFVGDEPKTCIGTDYVLLRSEIRDRAEDEPPWREQPERALVTMGGSDIANLMAHRSPCVRRVRYPRRCDRWPRIFRHTGAIDPRRRRRDFRGRLRRARP